MASLINSIRSVMGEPLWAIKILFFATILFFIMDNDLDYEHGNPDLIPFYIAFWLILLGCGSFAISRNIRNYSPLLPNLGNILEIIVKTIGSTIVIIPGILIYYACIYFIQNYLVAASIQLNIVFIVCATILSSPLILIPLVLYSVNGKITEAFQLRSFNLATGNFIIQMLSFILQYIFTIAILVFLLYTVLVEMLGDHPSLLALKCFAIVFSYFCFMVFCSEMYDEVIPKLKEKDDY